LLERLDHQRNGQDTVESVMQPETLDVAPSVHTEEQLDAMSDDQVAELLRMRLGQ